MFGTTKLGLGLCGAVVVAVVAVGATGCGGSAASSAREDAIGTSSAPGPVKSTRASGSPGTYEYQLRRFDNAQVAFSFRLGHKESIEGSGATASPAADAPLQLRLVRAGKVVAAITAHAADTPLPYANTGLGNGRSGVYRTTADIPADEAAAATHVRTALGEATVFTHPYFECTNSCKRWTVPVAVITLTAPKDPRFPTLVIAANRGELDEDGLREVLGRLGV
jgi:hypothetical protein